MKADIKTNADLVKQVREFFQSHVTAMCGLTDRLPEALRADVMAIKDRLNAALEKLPPIDQVPAAQEAGWALNCFTDSVVRMQDYAADLQTQLSKLVSNLEAKTTALNGLEGKVTAGELLTKEKATEACELARAEGAKGVLVEVVASRKSALELAGLPVPSDEVLGLPGTDYEKRLVEARANVAKLGEKGMTLGGKGSTWVRQTAWLGATEFAGQMTAIEDIIGTAGVKESKKADPLLGAPNGQEQPKVGKARPGLV